MPTPTRTPVITWTDRKGHPQQSACAFADQVEALIKALIRQKMSFSVTYINWADSEPKPPNSELNPLISLIKRTA